MNIFNTFNGFKVYEVEHMTIYDGEDWSRVRSPGRARRRRKKHRQNIVARYIPDPQIIMDKTTNSIYCHPEVAKKLRIAIVKEYEPKYW